MKQTIISEEPMSMVEVKTTLEKVQKSSGSLNFRAQKTLDHLTQTTTLGPRKAQDLEKKLIELNIPRMREQHAKKLVDTLPVTEKDTKVVLSGFNVTFTAEHLKAIAEVTKGYIKA